MGDERVQEDDDDNFYSNEDFLTAVAELKKVITKISTVKSAEYFSPSFSLGLTPTPVQSGHQNP